MKSAALTVIRRDDAGNAVTDKTGKIIRDEAELARPVVIDIGRARRLYLEVATFYKPARRGVVNVETPASLIQILKSSLGPRLAVLKGVAAHPVWQDGGLVSGDGNYQMTATSPKRTCRCWRELAIADVRCEGHEQVRCGLCNRCQNSSLDFPRRANRRPKFWLIVFRMEPLPGSRSIDFHSFDQREKGGLVLVDECALVKIDAGYTPIVDRVILNPANHNKAVAASVWASINEERLSVFVRCKYCPERKRPKVIHECAIFPWDRAARELGRCPPVHLCGTFCQRRSNLGQLGRFYLSSVSKQPFTQTFSRRRR